MPDEAPGGDQVRAAEVIAALSIATDLAIGVQLEHGLHSTLFAMRLAERLHVDRDTAAQTYYACMLAYVGCTADAEMAAELFAEDDSLTTYAAPARFGSRRQAMAGVMRALAPPGSPAPVRALQIMRKLPKAARGFRQHVTALCEVGPMLTDDLGLPRSMQTLFAHVAERWDGQGLPGRVKGDEIPLPLRIALVARDAAFQRMLGGAEYAVRTIRERAGGAFDPEIAGCLADGAGQILALDDEASVWEEALAAEPGPWLTLQGDEIDRALGAMGNFADLASPFLAGHAAGVAELAADAARRSRFDAAEVVKVRRAALVHDVGRAAVPVRIWQKAGPLSPDDREHVRLHAYHAERVLSRSPFLVALAPIATFHHERLDGTGYHRGTPAAALAPPARVLAAADAYHAMTEPRPHRHALTPGEAAETLSREARSGQLDPDAVAAVLDAAGQRVPRIERPAGLTEREAEVVGLLARGLQTKQIASTLGISAKTADRHVQNAYGKIGVSTRAAAALFAMQHGFTTWGELPMGGTGRFP